MPGQLRLKALLQHASLLAEEAWALLYAPLNIVLLAAACLWSGIFDQLPVAVPFAVMVVLACALVWTLRPALKATWPTRHTALRKLEETNAIGHRAASSQDDAVIADSGSDELWAEHQRRKLAALQNLKVASPASRWRAVDPLALRLPALMLALVAFTLGDGHLASGLRNAFSFSAAVATKPVAFDVWLKPPSYTGKPPLLLTSPAMIEKLKANPEITTPENAEINVRVTGASAPRVEYQALGSQTAITPSASKQETKDATFTAVAKLDRPTTLRLIDGGSNLATWNIATIPAEDPKIEIVGEPKGDGQGRLKVDWKTSAQYGVKSITGEMALADEQDGGLGFKGNGVFLYDPPQIKITMPKPGAKEDAATALLDLASHPWAGLWVELKLTATDVAGHTATTAPKRVKLAERNFIQPLARALVEQRKAVILEPEAAPDASTMIGTMLKFPFWLDGRAGLTINLAAINSRLSHAASTDEVAAITKDIWPLITAIEDGGLSDTKAELKNLMNQLRQALREGAPQDKIDELNRRIREAMKKLAEEMRKNSKQRQAQGLSNGEKHQPVSPSQLQQMLDQIEKLRAEGKTDEAEQMLSQLDQILQNLQPGVSELADGEGDGQSPLDEMERLMGEQRKLMDKTQRLGQGEPKEGESGGGLADKQDGLRQQLNKMGQGLGSDEGGDKFGEAGRAMREAEDALRKGNKNEALKQQNRAMQALREGMKQFADKQGKGEGQGNERGQAQGPGSEDPLGRPRPVRPNAQRDTKLVPQELAKRKSREILDELHDRANGQGQDENSKAYIDRLLKGVD